MKRTTLALSLVLALTGCGGASQENAAPPAPSPTQAAPSPSPMEDVVAKCQEIGPSLTAVSEALDRTSRRVITGDEGAALVAAEQVKVGEVAGTIQNATVADRMQAVADGLGRLRVELAERGDLDAATAEFEAAGDDLLRACTDAA